MTLERLQAILFWSFLGCFAVCCGIVSWIYFDNAIEADSLKNVLLKLFAVYSVHLSVVIGGMFALKGVATSSTAPRFAWSAVALAMAWNLLIAGRIVLFAVVKEDTVTSLIDYLTTIGASSVFLVAGPITFFFVKHPQ